MDAIIGRYKAHIEESGLILKHEAGIIFEFTLGEQRVGGFQLEDHGDFLLECSLFIPIAIGCISFPWGRLHRDCL